MKKVDFTKPILGLDGEPADMLDTVTAKPIGTAQVLGNILANGSDKSDSIGTLKLAMKIYNSDGPMTLEEAEYTKVQDFVKKSNTTVLVKAHLEKILSEAEDVENSA